MSDTPTKIARTHIEPTNENRKEWMDADKLFAYLNGDDIALTTVEHEKLKRCQMIYNMMMENNTKKTIIARMQALPELQQVSLKTIYNDMRDTEKIFGKIYPVNRDFERSFLLEMSRANIKLAMATKKSEIITKALEAHAKIGGLDKDDDEYINWKEILDNTVIQMNVDVKVIQLIQQLSAGGTINLDALIKP
jgi:hypothetical protein